MFKITKKLMEHGIVTNKYPVENVKVSPDFIAKIQVDANLCTGCQTCAAICPTHAISNGKVNLGKCIFCALCVEKCPNQALSTDNHYETAVFEKSFLGEFSDSQTSTEIIGKKLEGCVKELFGRSLNIREVDVGSCNGCDNEVSATTNPLNDLERFGIHFVASPRHADMLLVTGAVSRNMEEALIKTYNATPDPKLVVAVGTCAIDGGIFKGSYAIKGGVDQIIPMDLYIPGCPPRPQAIMYGLLKILGRIDR